MATVWLSLTRIWVSTPAAGEGISASTLSVEISKRGSSRSTRSPTFFSHFVTVPSAMLSPIWGIITSVDMHLSPSHGSGEWRVTNGKPAATHGYGLTSSLRRSESSTSNRLLPLATKHLPLFSRLRAYAPPLPLYAHWAKSIPPRGAQ